MKKILSLFLTFVLSFISFFDFVSADFEKEIYSLNNSIQNNIYISDSWYEYEERWARSWVAKNFLRRIARLLESDNIGIIQDKFIRKWLNWDDLTKIIDNRFVIAKKLRWISNDLDRMTNISTQMLIDYLTPILWEELAVWTANVLMLILW